MPRDLQDRISHGGTEFTENAIGTMLRNHILKSRKDNRKFLLLRLCVTVAILLTSCGYHVGGTASRLAPGLKVIDVSAFVNRTNQYRIEQRMTQAVVREFLERTRYRVVSTEESADAVLHGEITTMESSPVVFDTTPTQNPPTSSTSTTTIARATTMLVSVHMKVTLEERETKKILYKNDNYLFREIYEISTDPTKFFDEQSPALERMAKDFAARLVSDVVENF